MEHCSPVEETPRGTSMTHDLHVIAGAGAVGSSAALLLADAGHAVRLISRSGRAPQHPLIEAVALDIAGPDGGTHLAKASAGATAIYNCLNPAYHRWATDWPPLAAALLGAAEQRGAVLATVSNLYLYGPVDAPMTEQTPLRATSLKGFAKGKVRAQMWLDSLAAHEAGRARITEVRASDYIGPNSQSQFADRAVPRIFRGKAVSVLGRPDVPHTFTYTGDVARMLVTAATDERAWGRAWHVPSHEPRTARQVVDGLCDVAGVAQVAVRRIPDVVLTLGGLFVPILREFAEVRYQHDEPFVMDSSAAQQTFGLTPTPWREVLQATVDAHRPGR
jgi:nucleoside-diphosphate-sugar epimerase